MTNGSVALTQPITVSSFITAMESIGFVNDSSAQTSTSCTLYWGADTDMVYKLIVTVPASGNMSGGGYDNTYSGATLTASIFNGNVSVTSDAVIKYVKFGDSILLSVVQATGGDGYVFGLIAPVGVNDYWYMLFNNYIYSAAIRNSKACVAKSAASIPPNMTSTLPDSAVEVIKVYDSNGFVDNLYLCVLHPTIASRCCMRAQMGSKEFLIWNPYTNANYDFFAFDITEAS